MNNNEKIKQILLAVEKIRLNTQIGGQKLQDYLYYQHLKISGGQYPFMLCGLCGVSQKQVPESFKRAYRTLSDLERAQFYLLNVKILESISNSEQSPIQKMPSKINDEPKKLKILFKNGTMFQKQTIVSFEMLTKQKILRIVQDKTEIDLHNFLIRKSKNKQQYYLVLEATQSSPLGNTIRISHYGINLQDILNSITELWKEAQRDNIMDMIKSEKGLVSVKSRLSRMTKPKSQIQQLKEFDFAKTLIGSEESQTGKMSFETQYMSPQEDLNWQEVIETFVSFQKFQEISFGQYHEKNGLRVRKTITLCGPKHTMQSIQGAIESVGESKKRKSKIKSISVMGEKNQNAYTVYEIHDFGDQSVIFVYERKKVQRHGCLYIVQRSQPFHIGELKIDNMVKAKVHHCIWRIREVGPKIEVLVEAQVQYIKNDKQGKKSRKLTSLFLGDLGKLMEATERENIETSMFEQEKLSQISEQQEEQFFTVPGSLFEDENHQIVNTLEIDDELKMDTSITEQKQKQLEEFQQCDNSKRDLLSFKHIESPEKKGEGRQIISQKGHWLWENEWVIKDNGDLVNIDQQKINVQSSVLKLVAKRMGRNLLSGKSILNTSLPIQIFGTDSNIERMLRGYIFGPTFLEKAASEPDPLERFKLIICFAVGFSLAYIKMEKPFNPILGQTFQGLIGGCPVYAEQISHHPPIGSLLMVGRGYRVFGSFEAKVQMGLNTAAGINEGFNNVEFNQYEGAVRFTSPPGQLSGLIYGDRKITVARKSYYMDKKNSLFCQIQWGRNKSSKDELAKFNDFFSGKIVKLKSEANMDNYKNIKPTDIVEQLGQIRGRLTQKVCFNNTTIFDVTNEVPFQIEDYSPCLCSDSRLRKDIMFRQQKDFIKAQEAKQQLEILQRRDKKLRQEKH